MDQGGGADSPGATALEGKQDRTAVGHENDVWSLQKGERTRVSGLSHVVFPTFQNLIENILK